MTLTLTHDEVQQYFDMRDDLNYYKEEVSQLEADIAEYMLKCHDMKEHISQLEDKIAMLRQEAPVDSGFSEPPVTTNSEDYLPDTSTVISAYEAKETRDNRQGKTWDDLDIHIIRMAVGKVHPAFFISSLAEILGRTEQSINAKANELGFRVKNDRVVYKHD